MRRSLLVLASAAGLWLWWAYGSGYPVDDVDSEINLRIQALTDGEVFTFSDLTGTDCAEVGLVEAYASNHDRNAVVSRAGVSMEGQGQFTLLVAFEADGERVLASRLARVPYDFNDLGTMRYSCSLEFQAEDGAVRP